MTGPEDQSITGLIRRGLSSAGGTGAAGECPEPEVLAAYYDRALEPEEAARAEAHFSDCASCRAQLAALVRSDVPERKARGFAWLWGWRLLVPAAALGVGVLAVWIAVRTPLHPPQQVAEVKTIPAVTTKTAENPPPPAGSAAQSPAATGATERRKSANAGGGKLGRQSRAAGGEERREGFAADKVAPESPGAPAEETKKEAQMAQADTSKEAASGKPSTSPSAAPAPSVPVSPRPAGAFANKSYAGGEVRGETKREKAFAAVSGPREVRIATPDPLVIWRVGRAGMLERSEDGGAAWRVQIQKPAAALLAGSAPSAKVCWVVGRAGIVLRTTDGEHWMKVSSPAPADLVDVKAVDGAHATVTAADGRAFATADGGETWQQPAP
jgi:hypothetical protein